MTLPNAILLAPNDGGLPLARALHHRGVRVEMLVPSTHSWLARTRWARGHVLAAMADHEDEWLEVAALASAANLPVVPHTNVQHKLHVQLAAGPEHPLG